MRIFLVAVLSGVMAFALPHSALVAAAKRPRDYVIPSPPVVKWAYETVDPDKVNDGTQAVGAYADPANQTVHLPKGSHPFARAHEVGHLFDSEVLSDGDRNYFTRLMHAPAGAWDLGATTGRVQGEISPNEWFADYYGAAASGYDGLNGRPSIGSYATITPRRMRNFLGAIDRLGRRRDLATFATVRRDGDTRQRGDVRAK